MNELLSDDKRYWAIQQGDGNFVVYLKDKRGNVIKAIFDKWSYEANHPEDFEPQPDNPIPVPQPEPIEPSPSFPQPISGDPYPILIRNNVNPIGMAYWRNINQHRGHETLDVVLTDPSNYAVILTLAKNNLRVLNERQIGIFHTGEGLHYSAHDPYRLFVPFGEGLVKFNTISLNREIVWLPADNEHLWQCHVSYDESVFSASIQDNNYNIIKWGVNYRGDVKYYDLKGDPDECQIDKSGEWLLIKEDANNRIIRIRDGYERTISNSQGALGHSDCGFECAFGENDMSNFGGALDLIDFNNEQSHNVYHTDIWNMGYFSFSNAKPVDRNSQYGVLSSSDNRLIQVKLNGESRTICDLLTQSQEYENRSKANLCPNGEYAVWTALVNGQRNAYIVRIPNF